MKEKKTTKLIIFIGLIFIVVGFLQNDYRDTLMKAIFVCLECIGIG
ncbi:hypothetical protein LJC13_01375 [Peptostreptococcaceae bacterium OttesenSCG-928-C18]|nr:hypothetical protein [Peptostreptococcaceae bacterium OttesenSCG-928-C18]